MRSYQLRKTNLWRVIRWHAEDIDENPLTGKDELESTHQTDNEELEDAVQNDNGDNFDGDDHSMEDVDGDLTHGFGNKDLIGDVARDTGLDDAEDGSDNDSDSDLFIVSLFAVFYSCLHIYRPMFWKLKMQAHLLWMVS